MKTAEELQKELDEATAKAEANIKALQQKLSEKDQATKSALEKIAELEKKGTGDNEAVKQIQALTDTVKSLTDQVGNINTEKQKEDLAKAYPDILPDLLLGKSAEEREIIVTKQRELITKSYDEKPSAHAPIYKDTNAIDEAISRIKEDKSLDTESKFVKIGELKQERDNLQK